jgi:Icc-related predicted phosphoesterase
VRIVAVADTHLFTADFVVPDGDLFIHAGDMCRHGDLDEMRRAADWIASLPHRHKLVVAGNHDWAFVREPAAARAMFADSTYLEDAGTTIEGFRFYGSPWQPAFHDWAFNLPRGAPLADKWALIPSGLDVLVTHSPPQGFGDDFTMLGRAGCADLRARVAIVRPRLHLFGHIHQDGGWWEHDGRQLANVTTWECNRGATVIDIDAHAVTPVTVPFHGRRDR